MFPNERRIVIVNIIFATSLEITLTNQQNRFFILTDLKSVIEKKKKKMENIPQLGDADTELSRSARVAAATLDLAPETTTLVLDTDPTFTPVTAPQTVDDDRTTIVCP